MSVTNFQDRAIELLEAIAAGGGGGGGGGDASAANQSTEIARLDSLVTAIADQSTAAKQDLALTELQALVSALGQQATGTNQTTEIARLDSLVTAIADQSTAAKQDVALAELQKLTASLGPTLKLGNTFGGSSPFQPIIAPGIGKFIQILSLNLYPSSPAVFTIPGLGSFKHMSIMEFNFEPPFSLAIDTSFQIFFSPSSGIQLNYLIEYRIVTV